MNYAKKNYCYIDKTEIFEELLCNDDAKVSLITRPRRFGKTLTMSMMREFFDICKESSDIFKNLYISKNIELCQEWMNKYPVISISFKDIDGIDYSEAYDWCLCRISDVFGRNRYLIDSSKIYNENKERIISYIKKDITKNELCESFLFLSRLLHEYWGKKVIILIDEYDVPLYRAEQNGFYDEMVVFIRKFLGSALKGNDDLEFAILTGCLRVSKESIFTGLNNFECYGISDIYFADKFGFTDEDIDSILKATGLEDKKDIIKEWYDGYMFGDINGIYCPWDVLKYVKRLKKKPSVLPEPFWINSSSNDIIRKMIENSTLEIKQKIETLISLKCIYVKIHEYLVYNSLYINEENIWSILYSTGYLTKTDQESKDGKFYLKIPNKEILEIFVQTIKEWFKKIVDKNITHLLESFWNGDEKSVENILNTILLQTISYHDNAESYYHGFATALFVGTSLEVTSNRESGDGRPDVVVVDPEGSCGLVLELKHAETEEALEAGVREAIEQIAKFRYLDGLPASIQQRRAYGIAFHKKRCAVRLFH